MLQEYVREVVGRGGALTTTTTTKHSSKTSNHETTKSAGVPLRYHPSAVGSLERHAAIASDGMLMPSLRTATGRLHGPGFLGYDRCAKHVQPMYTTTPNGIAELMLL